MPRDRWVFVHAGSDCHEHNFVSNRADLGHTPAIELGGQLVLQLAGLGIDDIDIIDLYSCFPSAVQLAAQSLGLQFDRQLTRTGGMRFAGGPWNNYSMHAIATVVGELRSAAGQPALVWANGGYVTKHAFGIYSTSPPNGGFRHGSPQAAIDALASREVLTVGEGGESVPSATIEAYTVMHDRAGSADMALVSCLLADGRRAWGRSADLAEAMCQGEWVGRQVALDSDGWLTAS